MLFNLYATFLIQSLILHVLILKYKLPNSMAGKFAEDKHNHGAVCKPFLKTQTMIAKYDLLIHCYV